MIFDSISYLLRKMKLVLSLVLLIGLAQIYGARIQMGEEMMDECKSPQGKPPQGKPPQQELPEVPEIKESYEELLAKNSSRLNEIIEEGDFDISIFPREDEMELEMIYEDELNESCYPHHCAEVFYMPRHGSHRACHWTYWLYIHSRANIYATVCHTPWGDIPGFYWGGYAYYEFGGRLRRTCHWNWVGIINGRPYLYHNHGYASPCSVFGSYQKNYHDPLFFCVANYHGYLIPGKGDPYTHTCWYLHGYHTHSFYWVSCR